jgi:hypothetical protein
MDKKATEKLLCLCWGSNPGRPVVHSVATQGTLIKFNQNCRYYIQRSVTFVAGSVHTWYNRAKCNNVLVSPRGHKQSHIPAGQEWQRHESCDMSGQCLIQTTRDCKLALTSVCDVEHFQTHSFVAEVHVTCSEH